VEFVSLRRLLCRFFYFRGGNFRSAFWVSGLKASSHLPAGKTAPLDYADSSLLQNASILHNFCAFQLPLETTLDEKQGDGGGWLTRSLKKVSFEHPTLLINVSAQAMHPA
jgi:hypothetical protein